MKRTLTLSLIAGAALALALAAPGAAQGTNAPLAKDQVVKTADFELKVPAGWRVVPLKLPQGSGQALVHEQGQLQLTIRYLPTAKDAADPDEAKPCLGALKQIMPVAKQYSTRLKLPMERSVITYDYGMIAGGSAAGARVTLVGAGDFVTLHGLVRTLVGRKIVGTVATSGKPGKVVGDEAAHQAIREAYQILTELKLLK